SPLTSPPTAQPHTLSLHDALPISPASTAILEIKGADGSTVLSDSLRYNSYRTLLTKTQDYEFTVIGGNSAQDFTLSVAFAVPVRSEEHTSELQSRENLVCRLLLEK